MVRQPSLLRTSPKAHEMPHVTPLEIAEKTPASDVEVTAAPLLAKKVSLVTSSNLPSPFVSPHARANVFWMEAPAQLSMRARLPLPAFQYSSRSDCAPVTPAKWFPTIRSSRLLAHAIRART